MPQNPASPRKTPKNPPAACLAVLGTGSDVGKSIVAAALCRVFSDLGVRVAPFKAQNMSNNSGVTAEGLEMGRAQIVQAGAARIAPQTDMNPVLLKPVSNMGSQVILHGKPWMDATAKSYYARKDELWQESQAALARLRAEHELIVMEGAGSCAEVNLMAQDIVNLRAAEAVDAPVILVSDIDRGGVFAQIVGTLACLEAEQRARIKGFVVNRFRGDLSLFQPGVEWIEERTGKPVFGVLPWFSHFQIAAEDAVTLERQEKTEKPGLPRVGVIQLPHISNFTDFEPLARLEGIALRYLREAGDLRGFAAVILPGSKSTRGDLQWLRESGFAARLVAYREAGGHILGVCGGYQMLGETVRDPEGFEGKSGESAGLGLLPVATVLKSPKTTTRSSFQWEGVQGTGYEIHMGETILRGRAKPLFTVCRRNGKECNGADGAVNVGGHVVGTYMHGLFDSPEILQKWLAMIGLSAVAVPKESGPASRDAAYDALAQHAREYLDMRAIIALLPDWLQAKIRETL